MVLKASLQPKMTLEFHTFFLIKSSDGCVGFGDVQMCFFLSYGGKILEFVWWMFFFYQPESLGSCYSTVHVPLCNITEHRCIPLYIPSFEAFEGDNILTKIPHGQCSKSLLHSIILLG